MDPLPKAIKAHVRSCMWVFKTKQRSDGTLDRYKARLVAKRYDKQDDIDYIETFNLVIKPAIIQVF